jgi:hypothetical protein
MIMNDDVEVLKRGNLGIYKCLSYQVSYEQWRSKVTLGPGARLHYRAPPLLKNILEKIKSICF